MATRKPKVQNVPTSPRPALSHIDRAGDAVMVSVAPKAVTRRRAVAEGWVRVSPALRERIRTDSVAKGDVLRVARLAGMQAAKRTDELIPLCHTLPLDHVEVRATLRPGGVYLWSEATATARTGVEMEALTAIAVAALTVIDMGKAVDRSMRIEGIRLLEKTGGRSGTYLANPFRGRTK